MLKGSRTVLNPRKDLKPIKGLWWVMIMVLTIWVSLLFITFSCFAQSASVSSQRPLPRACQMLIFSTGIRVSVDSQSGQSPGRSRAQFGVAPHLDSNVRVSRVPNRRKALPWQQLTAKGTAHNLTGAPTIVCDSFVSLSLTYDFWYLLDLFAESILLTWQTVYLICKTA